MTEAAADKLLMDESAVRHNLERMAAEIVQRHPDIATLALIGIRRRGVDLAELLAAEIERTTSAAPALGTLDITLYRDDLMAIGPRPVVGETRLPDGGIDGRVLVIVDDVAYTGRTARAALDELADFGRPARILLCVLIDRGERELPIQPDIVGMTVDVPPGRRVEVRVPGIDGSLEVEITGAGQG